MMALDNRVVQLHLEQPGQRYESDSPSVLMVRWQHQESSIGHTDQEPQCETGTEPD